MRRMLSKPIVVFHAFLFGLAMIVAQQTPPGGEQDPQPQDQGAGAAIAQSGLLPIYGMTLELDKTWVDGKKFPSANPNQGVSDALQQIYDTQIAPCGFNVIRVPFDVNDGKAEESNKLANLLVWSQARGLKIAPVLIGAGSGKAFPKDYATRAKTFITTVMGLLKKNNAEHLGAWGQVAYLQLGYPLNHPGYHGAVEAATAADALTKAAANIRTAETAALGESGLSPSSIMVGASLDFELLKTGSIAGVELSEEAFSQSYEALKTYLALFSESPEIGMVSIEWFPGSVSSDATEKLPELVRALIADVQGKLLVLSTGFSTGFKTSEDQSRYYALAFANLADLRASEGVECPFTGVIWNTAIDTADANATPPSDATPTNMGTWDLSAKAAELVAMLQGGAGGDPDLRWWWKKTSGSFGVLAQAEGALTSKQAHEVLVELQGATAQAAVDTGAAEAAVQLEEAQIQAQTQGDPNATGTAPPIDPNTGLTIDPNTGLPIDPNTGLPIDPNNPTIDPNTGLPIDPNTGLPIDPNAGGGVGSNSGAPVVDELKNKLNGALAELLGSIIDRGKTGLSNLIGKFLGDPAIGTPGFDPNAGGGGGFPTDPNTGLPIDPNTGLPIDPNTGLPIDPNTGLPIDPSRTGGGDPPGGTGGEPTGGTGGADLVFESPVSPPGSLVTGEGVVFNVAIRNNGSAPAQGATAYLIDGDGNAFAASDVITIDAGASATGSITFVPPNAGAIAGAKVLLFCDNESNPADNENPLGSLNVSDPPGGVDEGLGSPGVEDPGPADPGTGGGTGGGGRPGGLRPGGLRPGGLLGIGKGGLLGILKPKLGAAIRSPGIAPKLSVITPGLFNVGALTPGTSAKLMTGQNDDDDDKTLSNGDEQGMRRPMIGFQPGQSIPLNIPITNPFKRSFRNVKATLFVNGQQIASRNLGSMMPKQTRTVSFGEFKPTSSGRFPTEVRFEAVGPKNRIMRGRAAGEIRVADPMKSKALMRPTIMPSAGLAKEGVKTMPRPVFGLVPTAIKTSILRPSLSPTLTMIRPGAGGTTPTTRPALTLTRPFSVGVVKTMSFSSKAAIGLSSDDVNMLPFPPAEGSQVAVSVKLQNRGMAVARGVKVEAFADDKSLKSQTLDVPAGQLAVANRFDKFPATLGNHAVRVVITVDGAPQEVTRTFEVKKGVLAMRPALSFIKMASLSFTGNDIQLSPTPQPNQPTNLSLNVRNPAGVPVNNAQFEAFADGRSLGKVQKTIGALQSANIGGFPSWTPPAGAHTLKVVATIGGRQIAAEKPVNVTSTAPIRPMIMRPTLIRPGTTVLPTLTRPGVTTPIITRPGATTPIITRPGTITAPGITRSTAGVDLGVSVEGISFMPAAPLPEQDVTIQVQIRNFGTAEATGANLTIGYRVDTQAMKTLQLPVNVKAGEQLQRSWRVKLPKGTQLQVTAQITHKDDKNAANAVATKTQPLTGATRPIVSNPGTILRPPTTTPTTTPITTRPGILTNPGTTLLIAKPDMAMTSADITFLPSSVKEGDNLTFTVRARNSGRGDAKAARLTLSITKDGAAHETKTFDFDAKAGETVTRMHTIRVPKARQIKVDATVSHPNDAVGTNQAGSVTVNVTQPLPILNRPGTLLPGAPIILAPAPDLALGIGSVVASSLRAKVGDTVKFTVKVRNTGRGNAKSATLTVRLTVDGRAAGGQNFTIDVNAGQTVERTVSLKVPAGRQVQCQASVAVSGDANGGNNSGSASVVIA